MERDVMDIIKDKEFIELTAKERVDLGELAASEDEFNQIKSMFAGISAVNWSNPAPKAETKESLDSLFAQKYPKAAPLWYNAPLAVVVPKGKPFYRQPLIQAAAVGLLIFLAYPLVNSNVMDDKMNQVASVEKEDLTPETKEIDVVKEVKSTDDANTDEISVDTKMKSTPDLARKIVRDQKVIMSPTQEPSATSGSIFDMTTTIASREVTISDGKAGAAAKPGSDHPDGIFMGDRAEIYSVPASRQPAVFDLLTSTF